MCMTILVEYFSIKKDSRSTRHEVSLVKDQCRLDIRMYLFSQKTINEWNILSADCVNASNVKMLKTKLTNISGVRVTQR